MSSTNNAINSNDPIQVALGGTGLSTITAHSVMIGEGASNVTPIAVGTNGQVLLGSTSADPAFATLTSSSSTLTYTTGAHTLNIEANGTFTGGISLPSTSSSSVGTIRINGNPVFHTYPDNFSVFVGSAAGNFTMTGSNNVGVGLDALNSNTTSAQCVAIGNNALINLAGGGSTARNTAVGHNSMDQLVTGVRNIGLGYNSGASYTTSESSNICINNTGTVGESNVIRIGTAGSGTGQQNACFIVGINGVTVASAVPVVIGSTGQLGTVVSSIRYKENVDDMADSSSPVLNLRPVTFNFKKDVACTRQFGLIAEEVNEVMPNLVVRNADGDIETVKYHELVPMLLNEVIKLNKRIAELESK
jgi:hypothetical protein